MVDGSSLIVISSGRTNLAEAVVICSCIISTLGLGSKAAVQYLFLKSLNPRRVQNRQPELVLSP